MQTLKKEVENESISQFQVTSDLLRNLYKFDLTPVTKLVLLELTTHLNESKNGSVVFPSVNYIAEVLGIGLTAAKKAINDLINKGLIIKSKRDNVKGNYNKYLLRLARIVFNKGKNENRYIHIKTDLNSQKTQNKPSENKLFKQSDSDLFLHEQKKVTKKQQTEFLNKGGNVYSEDDKILINYALKHNAKNIKAYVNKLKESGSAAKIIKEQQKKTSQTPYLSIEQTKKQIQIYKEYEKTAESYENSDAWQILGKKLGIK